MNETIFSHSQSPTAMFSHLSALTQAALRCLHLNSSQILKRSGIWKAMESITRSMAMTAGSWMENLLPKFSQCKSFRVSHVRDLGAMGWTFLFFALPQCRRDFLTFVLARPVNHVDHVYRCAWWTAIHRRCKPQTLSSSNRAFSDDFHSLMQHRRSPSQQSRVNQRSKTIRKKSETTKNTKFSSSVDLGRKISCSKLSSLAWLNFFLYFSSLFELMLDLKTEKCDVRPLDFLSSFGFTRLLLA